MSSVATGAVFGGRLCEALGLDKDKTHRIILDVEAAAVVVVTVEQWVTNEDGERVLEVLTPYALVDYGMAGVAATDIEGQEREDT